MLEKFAGENELKIILAKNPQSLNEYEFSVLRARVDYLTAEEKEKFGLNVIEVKEEVPEFPVVDRTAPPELPKELKKKVEIKKPLKGNKKSKK